MEEVGINQLKQPYNEKKNYNFIDSFAFVE